MKNKSLLALNFNIACNDYVKALCKKYDFDYDEYYDENNNNILSWISLIIFIVFIVIVCYKYKVKNN